MLPSKEQFTESFISTSLFVLFSVHENLEFMIYKNEQHQPLVKQLVDALS